MRRHFQSFWLGRQAGDIGGKIQPMRLVLIPSDQLWRRESRVGNAAGGNADAFVDGKAVHAPIDRAATLRTEIEAPAAAAIGFPHEAARLACNLDHLRPVKICADTEGCTGATLAGRAVAGNDNERVTADGDRQLATGA